MQKHYCENNYDIRGVDKKQNIIKVNFQQAQNTFRVFLYRVY